MGTATGRFAPFVWLGDTLMLMTREAFEHMQAQGVRGLLGCKAMLRFRQQSPLLDAASLPTSVDLLRVGNFATMIIATDRLRDAVLTRGLEGIIFRELPTR